MNDIERRLDRFAPIHLEVDPAAWSALSPANRAALDEILAATAAIDAIFLEQVARGNTALRARLEGERGPEAEAARAYFDLNYGPWDRLQGMEPFVLGRPHPPGAGYYPEDLCVAEFEAYLEGQPEERASLTSPVTTVERAGGALVAVPYSAAYREPLERAARSLERAAERTDSASLARYLRLRAAAFRSNDYFESDLAWMDLDSPLEVTIGPYETYEDGLFGWKAAFTAYVTLALPAESARLERFAALMPDLERNLPLGSAALERVKPRRGGESPIRVVDAIATAGDARAGVQTLAFNLPNDERVRTAKGSKNVLLRNVLRAKFAAILTPIAERVLTPEAARAVTFEAYWLEVLQHELAHGIGPGEIDKEGRATEVRLELKDLYSALEEAKADVVGVYNLLSLAERGEVSRELIAALEPTYVAGLVRAARFGIEEAHGQGVAAQWNFLIERGALEVRDGDRLHLESDRFAAAIHDLAEIILTLQATGDFEGTRRFLATYGQKTPTLARAIERVRDLPTDIRPLSPSPILAARAMDRD